MESPSVAPNAPAPAEVSATATQANAERASPPPPPYLGLDAAQVVPGQSPSCLYSHYFTPLMVQAYVTTYVDDCWVAWVADTGASRVFNQDAAWDEYRVFVKHGNNVAGLAWKPLGNGVGPVGGGMAPTSRSFTLALDGLAAPNGPEAVAPVVAWTSDESVHWGGRGLFASRWNGREWAPMKTASGSERLNAEPRHGPFESNSEADAPKLLRTEAGTLVLQWEETPARSTTPMRFQRTWNGAVFEDARPTP